MVPRSHGQNPPDDKENLRFVDAVIEILDARIPLSSRNPELKDLIAQKPALVLLNKSSLADPGQTVLWQSDYTAENTLCIPTDCLTGRGLNQIAPALRKLCAEVLAKNDRRGVNRPLRAMVLGIPNVGKSTLINRLSRTKEGKGRGPAGGDKREAVGLNLAGD